MPSLPPCRRLLATSLVVAATVGVGAGTSLGTAGPDNLAIVEASGSELAANFTGGGAAARAAWTVSSPAAGEVRLTLSAQPGVSLDAKWDLHASTGCTQTSARVVTCTATAATIDLHGMTGGQVLASTGAFNAYLIGGSGPDTLTGGSGNDRLRGMGGADAMTGGGGTDSADYTSHYPEEAAVRTQGVTVTLDGVANDGSSPYDGTGAASLGGDNAGAGIETILGTDHHDTLVGDAGDNLLTGYSGNDTIDGGLGSDRMQGSWGDDTLYAHDGVADAEVNCNNSDGSGAEQPNTAHYDAALDSPANCSNLVPVGGGGQGGGNAGGGGGGAARAPVDAARALQAGSIAGIERAGSWTVPAEMEPRFVKSGPGGKSRWDFTDFPSLRSAAKAAPFPIRIERKYVGSSSIPGAQRRFVDDGDIVDITPGGGTVLNGSTRAPAVLSVRIYDELMDIAPGSCPYRGKAIGTRTLSEALNSAKGVALASATRKLTAMKCKWTIVGSRLSGDDESAAVSFITSAAVTKLGPRKYVVRLNVVHPRQGLDLIIGPRDPSTLEGAGNAAFARRAGREMTLDDRGMLHQSARTPTTISVQPIVRRVGMPIRTQTKVVVTAKDGTVLASQEARTPNGVTTLTFPVPRTPFVTVTVTSTGDDGVSSLHGEKRIVVKGRGGPVRTVDGRCLKPAASNTWVVTECPAQAGSAETARATEAPAVTPLPYAVRWKIIDVVMGADGVTAPTRDRAAAICEAATPATAGGYRLVVDQLGPSRCLADAAMQALIREFRIMPALLAAKPGASCAGGLDGATTAVSYQRAAAFVDGSLRTGSTPAAQVDAACGVLGVYMDGRFFVDPIHYLATTRAGDAGDLINLDGGTLINLDGGGLINLDGGTLINLDGGTLINLDGGTLQGAVLRGGDGLTWGAQSPPQLVSDMGGALLGERGGGFIPVRIDPSLVDVGPGGLITKPRFP